MTTQSENATAQPENTTDAMNGIDSDLDATESNVCLDTDIETIIVIHTATATGSDSQSIKQPLLFDPGQVVSTQGALAALQGDSAQALPLLLRHLTGDWGDLSAEDVQANWQALHEGSRILSSYRLEDNTRLWLITEADRSVTTFLLPEEY